MTSDILLRNAHVIDPSQQINGLRDVLIRQGRIAMVQPAIDPPLDCEVRDLRGLYLCPGLVDLHGHWYEGSAFGIDPERCLRDGVTTVVDAGTTGFINFEEFRRHRIAKSRIRILVFLNIAATGIPTPLAGELEDIRLARPRETAELIAGNTGTLLGVKVRIGQAISGNNGNCALQKALDAAKETHTSVMVHISKGADTPRILRTLRAGDIVTHCFQGRGDGILENGSLIPEAEAAKGSGIIFDVGHGCGSFHWDTAKRAFEQFFYPDTISTDLHRFSVERFSISLPNTMSKFLHLGMSLEDVILKTTWAPARVLGRDSEIGTLRPGAHADLFAFSLEEGEFPLEDTHMKTVLARRRIHPELVMKAGSWIGHSSRRVNLRPLHDCDREILDALEETA